MRSHTGITDMDSQWYAVWTRSRQEKAAAAMLANCGVHHYLPLRPELRQWSDRKQTVEVPLFSGYLFVYIDSLKGSRLRVLKVPGIIAFVGNHSGPLPIPEQQIEGIKTVLQSGVECSTLPVFKAGDHVRVVRGPLTGVEGTLVRVNTESRLQVSIELVRQSIAVNIAIEDVEPVVVDSCLPRIDHELTAA